MVGSNENVAFDANGAPLSKNALKKLQKEKEKAEKALAKQKREEQERLARENAPVLLFDLNSGLLGRFLWKPANESI